MFVKIKISMLFILIAGLVTILFSQTKQKGENKMEITSTAFAEGELIPKKYTCDDVNVSPPLKWYGAPEGTKSFAIIADDPDAPMGTWVHWVLFNLPADVHELAENFPPKKKFDNSAAHGKNDFHKYGYGGPCPPGGTHRYYFKLYALDEKLDLQPGCTKRELLHAMKKHILAESHLMGKYKRQR